MQKNLFLLITLGIVGLALVIFLGAKTRNELVQYNYIGKSGRDTIVISGTGKVTATPDIAQITLGVTTDGNTVKDIQDKNIQKMNAIIDMIKKEGLKDADIQTQQYSISPRYDWTGGIQKTIGYTITQQVTVKVRDMSKSGEVVQKAGDLGANQIGNIQFVIDDPKVLESQAREKAISDAKSKADVLAKQLGLNIAHVVGFTEDGNNIPQPYPIYAKAMMDNSAGAVATPPTMEAGSQDVISNVSVTFEVR